jgi:hypothetical protein
MFELARDLNPVIVNGMLGTILPLARICSYYRLSAYGNYFLSNTDPCKYFIFTNDAISLNPASSHCCLHCGLA